MSSVPALTHASSKRPRRFSGWFHGIALTLAAITGFYCADASAESIGSDVPLNAAILMLAPGLHLATEVDGTARVSWSAPTRDAALAAVLSSQHLVVVGAAVVREPAKTVAALPQVAPVGPTPLDCSPTRQSTQVLKITAPTTLRAVTTEWSRAAGWQHPDWYTRDFDITHDAEFQGPFPCAIHEVLALYETADPPLVHREFLRNRTVCVWSPRDSETDPCE